MSSSEYLDLCINAQKNKNAKYHVYVFDVVNSRLLDAKRRQILYYKSIKLLFLMYETIKKFGDNILLQLDSDEEYLDICEQTKNCNSKFSKIPCSYGVLQEPFMFADTFGFTVYRNTISRETILAIFNKYNTLLKMDCEFHINDLYYETNYFGEGSILFFRGNAIDIAANLDKKQYSKLKKML